MAQITSITSEALQQQIRLLLPSQQGFGEDLQASNVITPIIDLTPVAEGSQLRSDLQTAISYGSQTAFVATNGNQDIASTGGFYRVVGTSVCNAAALNYIGMTDSITEIQVWSHFGESAGLTMAHFDLVFFLGVGLRLRVVSGSAATNIRGSIRQIADSNGTLIQPAGFSPQ